MARRRIWLLVCVVSVVTIMAGSAYGDRNGEGRITVIDLSNQDYVLDEYDETTYEPCYSESSGTLQLSANVTESLKIEVGASFGRVDCEGPTANLRYSYQDGYDCEDGPIFATMDLSLFGTGSWEGEVSFPSPSAVFICIESPLTDDILYTTVDVGL